MRSLCTTSLALLAAMTASAEPPSPLDLARGLRQEGMPELAMQYLDEVAPKLGADEKKVLPLEYARTRLDLAPREPEDTKRKALLDQARAGFDAFLKSNPNHPMRPEASLELARLTALRASDLFDLALSKKSEEDKIKALEDARKIVDQAAKQFETAAKALDEKLAGLSQPKSALEAAGQAELRRLQRRAMLEQGVNLLTYGQTYAGAGAAGVKKRGELIDQAQKVFEDLSGLDLNDPVCWEARAWATQCRFYKQEGKAVDEAFTALMNAPNRAAVAGKRQARYFMIRNRYADRASDAGRILPLVMNETEIWLKAFPNHANTREGLHVRYMLARSMHEQVEINLRSQRDENGELKNPPTGQVGNYLRTVVNIYKSLADTQNQYTDDANRYKMRAIVDLSAGKKDGPPDSYATFEEAYIAAQVEQARLGLAAEKAGSDLSGDEFKGRSKKVYDRVVDLLGHWIPRTGPKDDAREVFEARLLLVYALLTTDRTMQAAVLGEHIARTNPDDPKALRAAATALQAYSMSSEPGETHDADQARIMALARFMDGNPTWATEVGTDVARHQLGLIYYGRQNYVEAAKALNRVSSGYPSIYQARLVQGASAFLASKQGDVPESTRTDLVKQAITDLSSIPALSTAADGDSINSHYLARIQYGQLHLLELANDYAKASSIGKELVAEIGAIEGERIDPVRKAELSFQARSLELSGVYGLALAANKAGDYAKVDELLQPVIDAIEKELKADEKLTEEQQQAPSLERLKQVRRNVLVLALRTTVQDAQIERARDLLAVLEKAGGSVDATINVLKQVVGEVKSQIDILKREGKDEDAKKVSESFAALLDQIADRRSDNQQLILFLARGYGSIDRHAKAAEQLSLIPRPKKSDPDFESQEKFYRTVQFLQTRAFRQAGAFDKAKALLEEIMGDAKNKGWGFNSVEVRKESFYLIEDEAAATKSPAESAAMWRDALSKWTSYSRVWQAQLGKAPQIPEGATPEQEEEIVNTHSRQQDFYKSTYWDLFIETYRCMARANDSFDMKPDVKEKGFAKVAEKLVALEESQTQLSIELREKIRDVVSQFPVLKQKYVEAGGKLVEVPTSR